MIGKIPASLTEKLSRREIEETLHIPGVVEPGMADFSSNDYLGLAASTELFEATHAFIIQNKVATSGATGSRVLSGSHSLFEVAEKYIANYHEAEGALIFNSGYDANVGFFSSVPQKGDVVLYDEHIHASIRDGLRLSGATAYKFPHNDKEALFNLVERYRPKAGELYIVTEAVFSMDGDTPNLAAFVEITEKYRCRLVVDEAHAVGVFGEKGEGLLQAYGLHNKVFARIITFGKALGCHGAAVLGPEELIKYLANFARSFIYTTALPPHSLATIISAYKILESSPEKLTQLHDITMFFKGETERCNLKFILSFSTIHCIAVPGVGKAKKIAATLQRAGFSVKPLLEPRVPAGQERLRFCIHAFNTKREISTMMDILTQALRFS
ncbi:aminotransferase class I/II-fold pyridoxal phosphate-dependent enzyme [Flavobacterium psychrotrophum]|uniref:aminotransferase class I/II-fold pyridoxal phosphate-dependent enzyme n=1 Tax=Flavobacterium psychrotrophum TaxID=2294119 RepID=UPI000E31D0BE|nr:aminotransferase class I/II-fold pyridoxal phosphate-dependent enzyme [Flavobacterium psychrotrophum]